MSLATRPQPLPAPIEDSPPKPVKTPDVETTFVGPGFGFVRSFLLIILLVVGAMLILAGFLSWHFGMDITVEGQGTIEPKQRQLVKAEIAGIIQKIHVRQGQQINLGALLVTLDDTHWKTELQKTAKDLEVNRSQQRELEQQIEYERQIRRAQVLEARLAVDRASIQLEQVMAEQQLYASASLLGTGVSRRPLNELVPVRLSNAHLEQRSADLVLAEQQLSAVKGRKLELQTLEKRREKFVQEHQRLQTRLSQSTIRAPATGTVLTGDLERRVGDRLQEGEAILEVGKTDEWRAKIMVQEIDLPKIALGQPVRLYVNAFPHMEYKIFEGRVEEVPTAPAEVNPTGGAVYPIGVSIQDPQVVDEDKIYSLAYGMNAEAKIIVDRGRILELLWKKLLRSGGVVGKHDFYMPEQTPASTKQEENQ